MKTNNFDDKIASARVSIFSSEEGADEIYLSISASCGGSFQNQWEAIKQAHKHVCADLGLGLSNEVIHEIYISDISNQKKFLLTTPFVKQRVKEAISAVAISQLAPLAITGSSKIHMKSYYIKGKQNLKKLNIYNAKKANIGFFVGNGDYEQFWFVNFCDSQLEDHASSYEQTNDIFSSLLSDLSSKRMTLLDNAIRTWIYVRDIDNNYAGMVNARREIFDKAGLNRATRYIASTGIEGSQEDSRCLVSMNALFYRNIETQQIKRMQAPGFMKSPYDYGVTFERGTELLFGDRKHMYISGTASIDQDGRTLYVGDIVKQARRTMDNIKALLEYSNSKLSDIAYLVVYLRDGADYLKARDIVFDCVDKNTPVVFLRSSVCRPDWLVEIEGVAISGHKENSLSAF